MGKARLEAFSDGVLAIIITIMVLAFKVPHGAEWSDLQQLSHIFLSYLLSFLYVAIYWGNHHHLLHTVKRVSGSIIWANMALLFCLSLIPFATDWMGENHFAQNTVITYSVLMMCCGLCYYVLQKTIQVHHKTDAHMARIYTGLERKGVISLVMYALAIGLSFYHTALSGILFFAVAAMWIVPDKNTERLLEGRD